MASTDTTTTSSSTSSMSSSTAPTSSLLNANRTTAFHKPPRSDRAGSSTSSEKKARRSSDAESSDGGGGVRKKRRSDESDLGDNRGSTTSSSPATNHQAKRVKTDQAVEESLQKTKKRDFVEVPKILRTLIQANTYVMQPQIASLTDDPNEVHTTTTAGLYTEKERRTLSSISALLATLAKSTAIEINNRVATQVTSSSTSSSSPATAGTMNGTAGSVTDRRMSTSSEVSSSIADKSDQDAAGTSTTTTSSSTTAPTTTTTTTSSAASTEKENGNSAELTTSAAPSTDLLHLKDFVDSVMVTMNQQIDNLIQANKETVAELERVRQSEAELARTLKQFMQTSEAYHQLANLNYEIKRLNTLTSS